MTWYMLFMSWAKLASRSSISCWNAASIASSSMILPRMISFSSIAYTRAARNFVTSVLDYGSGCTLLAFVG